MKILQLCKKFPYPLKDGESIAVNSLSKSLHELGCEVTLLAMNTHKHFFDTRGLPASFNHYQQIHTVRLDNRIKAIDAFANLFSRESYHISRFISNDFEQKLVRLLRQEAFDLVQLETLYLAPYIPLIRKHSEAVVSMRAHNVEHEIWERIAANTRFWPKKLYLRHLTRKLRRYEIEQLAHYDILAAITRRDLTFFRDLGYPHPGIVTPIGIDSRRYQPDYGSYARDLSIAFIGSLDWAPNLEGLQWFLKEVWPRLRRKYPRLTLHIAGRNTPDWMYRNLGKNVTVHGEVADASSFVNQHSLTIVPLLSGSGMRAKILESMALGKVVITTALGLEGIHARDRQEVLVANQPEDFVRAIGLCVQKGRKLEKMGRRAREFVSQYYDSKEIARQLMDTYSSLMVEAL